MQIQQWRGSSISEVKKPRSLQSNYTGTSYTFTSSLTRIFEILFSIFVKSHEKHLWYLSLKLDSAARKSNISIKYSESIKFPFKLELIKKMSLAGVLFETNQSFQFEVFLREAKRDVIVRDSVEMRDIFVIVKSRIGILVLEIKMHFWTF